MERSLYPPVKRFLESLGFHVKGEIGSCGLAAKRPRMRYAGELKLTFSLDLGANVCDEVCLL